jgi:hypothetical protein
MKPSLRLRRLRNRLMTGVCEGRAFLVKRGAESRERGRPRPQQRVLRQADAQTCPVFRFHF